MNHEWSTRSTPSLLWALAFVAILLFFYLTPFSRPVFGWMLSEALINYEGGFVRRGLLGQAVYLTHHHLGWPPFVTLHIVFASLYATCVVIFVALSRIETNLVRRAVLLFSPALLMFPTYYVMSYPRKDVFIILALCLHALVTQKKLCGDWSVRRYAWAWGGIVLPLLCINVLIHETQVLFIPIHLLMSLQVRRSDQGDFPSWVLGLYALPVIGFALAAGHPGSPEIADAICHSWGGVPDTDLCALAIASLKIPPSNVLEAAAFIYGHKLAFYLYLLCLVLSVAPYFLFYRLDHRFWKAFGLDLSAWRIVWLAILTAPLALFVIGYDYGRWINLVTTALFSVVFSNPVFFERLDKSSWAAWLKKPWVAVFMAVAYVTAWSFPSDGLIDLEAISGLFFERASQSYRLLSSTLRVWLLSA